MTLARELGLSPTTRMPKGKLVELIRAKAPARPAKAKPTPATPAAKASRKAEAAASKWAAEGRGAPRS
ncbi:hypothetical protein GCM10007977_048320 [Dactylosporangium sucinum]|uniref:Uncharacterized protein n=1 Tax=Dactylosporangium sucinum TaxID=1424081 RepID=A0A917TXB6_9ACTN|nr:hypothetical protein GCM10007977_048320 [Dactylosporangium sucinum]